MHWFASAAVAGGAFFGFTILQLEMFFSACLPAGIDLMNQDRIGKF